MSQYNENMRMLPRYLREGATAEFQDDQLTHGRMLMVGKVIAFAVVKYTHKLRGRAYKRTQRVEGEVVMVFLDVVDPAPQRVGNMYTCAKDPSYRARRVWVAVKQLTSFLHVALARDGDLTMANLVVMSSNY